MSEPVIQTHQLTKIFHHPFFTWKLRARAVTDLTMAVNRGEVFGLLGPNGSGKSTTIKILLGLIFPTSGKAAMFGRLPSDVQIKSRIGFLPEESYLYRFLDAEETLDFYGRLFNLTRQERKRRVDSLLDLVGLRHERRRPIIEFSKGMQRRVGIAQSLINDPELVIMDEPTTGLDPLGTREIKDLIVRLKEKGKTVLLSSHLLADVEDVCDRVAILYGGRLQAEGRVDDLLQSERLVQITAQMDNETVEEVKQLIVKRMGEKTDVSVGSPVERLEQYFLRVVEDAQTRKVATSGASDSGSQLDFLTGSSSGTALLEELSRAEEISPSQESKEFSASSDAGGAVLEKLTEQQEPEQTPDDEPEPGKQDDNLLDQLTRGED